VPGDAAGHNLQRRYRRYQFRPSYAARRARASVMPRRSGGEPAIAFACRQQFRSAWLPSFVKKQPPVSPSARIERKREDIVAQRNSIICCML